MSSNDAADRPAPLPPLPGAAWQEGRLLSECGCCDGCTVIQLGRLPGSIKLAAENGACASPEKYEPLPGPCAAGWFSCTQEGRDAASTSELAEKPLGGGIPASVFGAGIEDGRGAPY